MICQNRIRILLVSNLLLISFSLSPAQPRNMKPIATGIWGGPHINITVAAKSATIEYDCAHGTITGPLVVDSEGHFKLRGTHTMERGGPVRMDETPNQHPALYTGYIKGDSMTLTVKLSDTDETFDTYTLVHGKSGRVFKCK